MENLVIDPWAGLNHHITSGFNLAEWVPVKDQRRLNAYTVLSAYARGTAWQLPGSQDRRELREYGDPGLLIEQTLASVMGDSQEITSPDEATQAVLREWAVAENFSLKLMEAERKAVTLGDAVYLLEFGERPRLKVIDPAFYFPVLEDGSEYPSKVHLAWNFEDGSQSFVKRITYELKPVEPYSLPWNKSPATVECFVTEATWEYGGGLLDLNPRRAKYATNTAGETIRDYPLGIDFIPLVHVPNTVTGAEHFGVSTLTPLVQLLDDLNAADTDATAASATTGTPMLVVSDPANAPAYGSNRQQEVAPGAVWWVNQGGRVETINTAPQLAEMRERVKDLTTRLSRNARIPEVALGGETSALSGVALQIQYSPLNALVRSLRLARAPKYALLFKMVQRMMTLTGQLKTVYPAALEFGAFMPKDQETTVSAVVSAVAGKVITVETGLRMLEAAGVPVADDEARILESRDYSGALSIVEATGDTAAARQKLGLAPATMSVERRQLAEK
ncbi:MAG: hypothetical protein SPK50_02970 [Mobiluncus porci]|uniref:hypothetical protein n=1 Tax=Mobiluncus porci TaxID=2652278 RepID=UPI0023F5090B|nr:hypothetical protein [Mobiluncus porci]MDD7541190.1 hypothetical protein [Mobiluncus porci]MDY5748079.1 hypothetical protein [Mobiluncus porci]